MPGLAYSSPTPASWTGWRSKVWIHAQLLLSASQGAKRPAGPIFFSSFSFPPQQDGKMHPPPLFLRTTALPTAFSLPTLWLPLSGLPGFHANKVPMVTRRRCCIPIGSLYSKKRDRYCLQGQTNKYLSKKKGQKQCQAKGCWTKNIVQV